MSTTHRIRPWLAGLAFLASGGAWAAHVTPTPSAGQDNFTAEDCPTGLLGAALDGGLIDNDGAALQLIPGIDVIFTRVDTPAGVTVDFSSPIPLDIVVVKGGSSGYNLYDYRPAGETGDDGLHAPLNPNNQWGGLSHVVVCYLPKPTGEKSAQANWDRYTDWSLEKTVTPASITMFDGDSHDASYTVSVTPTSHGTYRVSGQILVRDLWDWGWSVTGIVDNMNFNNNAMVFSRQWDGPGGGADTMSCTSATTAPVILSCSYQFELQSADNPFLTSATGGLNKATISAKKGGTTYAFDVQAAFAIPGAPANSFGDSLSVQDVLDGVAQGSHEFNLGGPYQWNYTRTYTCGQDHNYHNVATGTWSEGSTSDAADVMVDCETVAIDKTAETTYSRDYAWDLDKKVVVRAVDLTDEEKASCEGPFDYGDPAVSAYACDDVSLILQGMDSQYETVYRLTATRTTASEYDFGVDGQITATWPAGLTPVFVAADPVDTLLPSNTNAPTAMYAETATSRTWTYQAGVTGKADASSNRAVLTRPHVCYAANNDVVACAVPGNSTYTVEVPVTWGDPELTNFSTADLIDLFNAGGLNLGNSFEWEVAHGLQTETFTTYVTGNINDNGNLLGSLNILPGDWTPQDFQANACTFMVPNLLSLKIGGDGTLTDDANIDVYVPTACNDGCTLTQGYWKTHSKYGPAPYDATWEAIGEDTLFFSSGQSWYAVFWTAPKGGNAYYILAHQYMAARLNVEAGASAPQAVLNAIADATAWFTGRSTTAPKGVARNQAIELAGILGAYNEGTTGPGHCSISPNVAPVTE